MTSVGWVGERDRPRFWVSQTHRLFGGFQRRLSGHVWLVEPLERFLEVLELDGSSYRIVQRAVGDEPARVRPFDAIEFDVAALWAR